MGQKMGKKD